MLQRVRTRLQLQIPSSKRTGQGAEAKLEQRQGRALLQPLRRESLITSNVTHCAFIMIETCLGATCYVN